MIGAIRDTEITVYVAQEYFWITSILEIQITVHKIGFVDNSI